MMTKIKYLNFMALGLNLFKENNKNKGGKKQANSSALLHLKKSIFGLLLNKSWQIARLFYSIGANFSLSML